MRGELRSIRPSPALDPEIAELSEGRGIVYIRVPSGAAKPYTHNGLGYYRERGETVPLRADRERQLRNEREAGTGRWEMRAAAADAVALIDRDQLLATYRAGVAGGRLPEVSATTTLDLLRGFGLLTPGGEPTNAAVALFARTDFPWHGHPQLLLRCARFRGVTKNEFVDNKAFRGGAFELWQRARQFILDHIPIRGRLSNAGDFREDAPLYPMAAIREVLANAFCHRDYDDYTGSVAVAIYDDRLEVHSVGLLPAGLSPEDLKVPHASHPTNPLVAETFYKRGLVERWGRGTVLVMEELRRAGLPEPEYFEQAGSFYVRLRPERYFAPERVDVDLTELQRAILTALASAGREGAAMSQLAETTGSQARTIRRHIEVLISSGLARRSGQTKARRYFLNVDRD